MHANKIEAASKHLSELMHNAPVVMSEAYKYHQETSNQRESQKNHATAEGSYAGLDTKPNQSLIY